MSKRPRVTFEDSEDLGFAITCVLYGAIGMEEFTDWVTRQIMAHDDLPSYMFDLIDFTDGDRLKLSKWETFGHFLPMDGLSHDQTSAVAGIGAARFADYDSDLGGRPALLAALMRHPEVKARFREAFPDIEIPD